MSLYELKGIEQYYDKRCVLKVAALQVHDGEILAIVGPSGAGKSTLLRLLGFLEAPTLGTCHLCTRDGAVGYQDMTMELRRQITMVFQRPMLMSRSVQANVGYGLRIRGRKAVRQHVARALEQVSLSHLADARSHTLSGGEMQRVSIARALVLQPRILLLDEPTANLDPYNVRLIEDFVRQQHESHNTTIVMITHNIFQAKRLADRVVFVLNGEVVEVAEAQAFFDNPKDQRTRAFISGDLIY